MEAVESSERDSLVLPVLNERQKRSLFLTYVMDWFVLLVLFLIAGVLHLPAPFQQQVYRTDDRIRYPFAQVETVSTLALALFGFGLPCLLIFTLLPFVFRASPQIVHFHFMALCFGSILTLLLTQILKITVGRPRPDFLDRCKPVLSDNPLITECSGDAALVNEGRLSFPSGHASISFAGMTFLSLMICAQLRTFDGRIYLYRYVMSFIPLVFALLIAISRYRDYRHHWEDITVGSLIGIFLAYFTYRQYFNAPWSRKMGQSYLMRERDAAVELNVFPKTPFNTRPSRRANVNNENRELSADRLV